MRINSSLHPSQDTIELGRIPGISVSIVFMCNFQPDARHVAVFIFWHAHTTIFQHIYRYCVCYQNSIWLPFDSSNSSIWILSLFRDLINFFDWGFSWMMIAGDFIISKLIRIKCKLNGEYSAALAKSYCLHSYSYSSKQKQLKLRRKNK